MLKTVLEVCFISLAIVSLANSQRSEAEWKNAVSNLSFKYQTMYRLGHIGALRTLVTDDVHIMRPWKPTIVGKMNLTITEKFRPNFRIFNEYIQYFCEDGVVFEFHTSYEDFDDSGHTKIGQGLALAVEENNKLKISDAAWSFNRRFPIEPVKIDLSLLTPTTPMR